MSEDILHRWGEFLLGVASTLAFGGLAVASFEKAHHGSSSATYALLVGLALLGILAMGVLAIFEARFNAEAGD